MNDVERRLKELGEKADDRVGPLSPRPESLRRIRRRRLVTSTSAFLSVALVLAGGAWAWSAASDRDDRPLPPADGRALSACERLTFEPTYLPDGFDRTPRPPTESRPHPIAWFDGGHARSIEVVTPEHAYEQTQATVLVVLGTKASIGAIHEGYSVELVHGGCEFVLNGWGVTRAELAGFAGGLRSIHDALGEGFAAIWPEDTSVEAERGCVRDASRRSPTTVAADFATGVIGWDAAVVEPAEDRVDAWTVRPDHPEELGGEVRAGILVSMAEVMPRCWSIVSVSRLPDRGDTGLGVSVAGDEFMLAFDPLGAASATAIVAYGTDPARSVTLQWERGQGDFVRTDLPFHPSSTGHFLIFFRDEEGRTFSAAGGSLPPGDFTAG